MSKASTDELYSKLAAAIGEQTSESTSGHNHLAQAVDELRTALDTLAKKVTAERVSAISRAEETQTRLNAYHETCSNDLKSGQEVGKRLVAVEKKLAERTDQTATLKDKLVQLEQSLAESADATQASRKKIADLEKRAQSGEQASARVQELDTKISELQKRADEGNAAQERLTKLETTLKEQTAQLESASAAHRAAENFEKTIEERDAALSKMQTRINELQDAVNTTKNQSGSEADAHKNELTQRDTDLRAKAERIQTLESKLDDVTASLDDAREASQKLLKSQQAKTQSETEDAGRIAKLETRLQDQDAKIKKSAGQLRALEESESTLRSQLEIAAQPGVDENDLRAAEEENATLKGKLTDFAEQSNRDQARAQALLAELEKEKANGTKATLAMQLAEALQEHEESQNEVTSLKDEVNSLLARIENEERATSPAPPTPAPVPPAQTAPAKTPQPDLTQIEQSLVDADILSPDQVDSLRRAQDAHPEESVLRVVVQLGFAGEQEVRNALEAAAHPKAPPQPQASAHPEAPAPPAPFEIPPDHPSQRVGEILIDAGVISEAQLKSALKVQGTQPTRRLGQILVDQGLTTDDVIVQALGLQQEKSGAKKKGNGHDAHRKVGEIMIDAGVITPSQLDAAIEEQRKRPDARLGALLIEKGFTTEEVVAQALAYQRGVEFLRIQPDVIERSAVRLVNARLAEHHCCIPIRIQDQKLILAMVNPLDLVAIEDIERASEHSVEPVVATASDINTTIRQFYY